jgi:hypothetical protein
MTSSTSGQEIAFTILREFERARSDLLGKAVVLSDGKAGTIETVFLDELHGLRIAVKDHKGKWPISTLNLRSSLKAPAGREARASRSSAAVSHAWPPDSCWRQRCFELLRPVKTMSEDCSSDHHRFRGPMLQ